jgi:flagellar hook-associated protein 3 FlgL
MYYKNIYGENNSQLNQKLFNVNKQIASGLKIQFAQDDIRVFSDTMRLDNEINVLGQIKSSVDNGYKVSDQSDVILSSFEERLADIKPLLLQAINDTNSDESRDAIAKELRSIEKNLRNLANSSINGKYLFSGSALDVKPITEDGRYMGNDAVLNSFVGTNVTQQYNISGAELFLGENSQVRREVSTNVVQSPNVGTTLDSSTTMADYNGTVPAGNLHNFYLRGTQSDGTSFKTHIQLTNANTIDDLLTSIGQAYGNGGTDVVTVSMNSSGEISIVDKLRGSSKLDFHMVGASDFDAIDHADITAFGNSVDDLVTNGGETDYATALASATQLFVREYNKSPYSAATGVSNTIDARLYDRTEFSKDGPLVSSNTPQIVKEDNSFANKSTKLHEVFSGITYDSSGEYVSGLDTKVIKLEGVQRDGVTPYSVDINLLDAGTTFTDNIGGGTYTIYNMDSVRAATPAGEVTYQQLMDVMNMAVTNNLPAAAPGSTAQYDTAVELSNLDGSTSLSYDGKIEYHDLIASNSQATIAMYDSNSDNFASPASVMTFNTNNSLTVRDPKTDFFKELNDIITSVEDKKNYPDASFGDSRNIGMQNSLSMYEDLFDHISKQHSTVGAQSNSLSNSIERTTLLELSSNTLRASVIDTDLAESSLKLTQLSLNYEAMLSTVGKISQLSLVNYL